MKRKEKNSNVVACLVKILVCAAADYLFTVGVGCHQLHVYQVPHVGMTSQCSPGFGFDFGSIGWSLGWARIPGIALKYLNGLSPELLTWFLCVSLVCFFGLLLSSFLPTKFGSWWSP